MASFIGKKYCARVLYNSIYNLVNWGKKAVKKFAPNHTTTKHNQVIKKTQKVLYLGCAQP